MQRIEKGQFDVSIAMKSNLHTADVVSSLNHNSAKDAILSFSPSISTVKAYHGIEAIKIAVCALIADKSCRLIQSRQMNPQAYLLVAAKIVEDYWFLKLSEIKYAFDCGFRQKEGYGGMFHGFDESVMMLWIESYISERDKVVENIDKDKLAKIESVKDVGKYLTDEEKAALSEQTKSILEIIGQFSAPFRKTKMPIEFCSVQQVCRVYGLKETEISSVIKSIFENKFHSVELTQFIANEKATEIQQFVMWQRARLLRACSREFGGIEGVTAEMLYELAYFTANNA